MRFFVFGSIACFSIFSSALTSAAAQAAGDAAAARPTSEEVIARSGVPESAVAAVVNDAVVTTYDVRQRIRLMLLSAGGRIPPEALPQIQAQALQDLIDEKLKLQEAARFDLTVSDEEITQELSIMAAQSNLTLPQMVGELEQTGISLNALKDKIRTDIAWPQLVQGRYRDRVRVNDTEIETTLERMREDATKEQYLVSEICIPVDNPSQAQQYYQGSMQLIEQMRKGVPFAVVAQQFSACTTAAVGGDLGWVRAGELPPELDSALETLPVGAVTNPIPSEGAFMILAVRDKRAAAVQGEPTFTLAWAAAEKSMGSAVAHAALEKVATANICSGQTLRIDLGPGVGYSYIENVTLNQIDERFRPFIEDLVRGDTSTIVEADGAYHEVYVCDKDEGLGLPSREAIENRIFSRQLNRIGQQYLRDIERESMVDVRLKNRPQPNG